ncbi:tRNA pseudouridine synthase A [Benincasa hispida]|uniref:tRNA pseudouridine synthase A n=1 Tax=Benincasa hispida TaxID=102211 RepID=UPI0018FF6B60|nr:tRNA pseudouridine synthase A [Benincasa hispida]
MIPNPRARLVSPSGAGFGFKILMENRAQQKDYLHYNHTDRCRNARWTARESYQLMYGRPWQEVLDFYFHAVNGRFSLSSLFGTEIGHDHDDAEIPLIYNTAELNRVSVKDKTGRWARATFKIVLSYHGNSFDGWQKQPGLNTVQGLVEKSLGKFVDDKKAQMLKDKCLPIEGCAVVAGRTDKGVTALRQVCSFYTWRTDVQPQDIEDSINRAAPGKLRTLSVSQVSRIFHPNFSAKWRRYLYIFPLNDGENMEPDYAIWEDVEDCRKEENYGKIEVLNGEECKDEIHDNLVFGPNDEELVSADKPQTFSIRRVNQLLRKLEGKLLSYKMFARDTKASRNEGPPTECFVYHARAVEARLPCLDQGVGRSVMCVELVANRFLRKMVRVLVATAIREAAAGAGEDALLELMDATCRRATAPPAPPDGLSLVDVGYTEFDSQNCFILND